MSATTKIEWTDRTWNPVTGCTKVSAGCDHCYAESIAERFRGGPAFPNGFDVQLREHKLTEPLRWRIPSKVFVNSMSDLFHDEVPDEYIAKVFAVMASAPRHTFQVLTKRHGRMRALLSTDEFRRSVQARTAGAGAGPYARKHYDWPLPNVWIGVSAENQQWADIRIPALLDTPAAVRFVSAEPLLGPIDLEADLSLRMQIYDDLPPMEHRGIDWVIVGGESGSKARPMDPEWARDLRDQCDRTQAAFLFKQFGEWRPTGEFGVGALPPRHTYGSAAREWPHGYTAHEILRHVGTKTAGRELDGRTWDEFPDSAR